MIEYAPYQLTQKSALNRMDLSAVREGVLIRVDGNKYACIHPWPELGDSTLAECLSDLRAGNENPLVARALYAAEQFGQFVEDAPKIQSHATLPKLNGTPVLEAVDAEFQGVKVKRGKDWVRLRKKTEAFIKGYPCLRWRFDFNGAMKSHRELSQFLGWHPRAQIDFIEDPFDDTTLADSWRGFPIAYDRVIPEQLNLEQNFLIAKPALQSLEEIDELATGFSQKVVFTSYMDHPVGQLFALQEAQRFYKKHGIETPPLCGLATQDLYEATPYHALLGASNPMLEHPPIAELISLLEKEDWQVL